MRPDSLNPILRRNDPCDVQLYLEAREQGRPTPVVLDRNFEPGSPRHLVREASGPDLSVLRDPSRAWAPSCLREVRSDRLGAISTAPLLWQGALPGVDEHRAPMFVRDLGPDANLGLIERYPDRTAWILAPGEAGRILLQYGEGIGLLWSEAVPSS